MDDLSQKLVKYFSGKIVRKDLTQNLREGANVPVFVLEYLLGSYCSTDDEKTIEEGIESVKEILSKNYVRPDESEKVKSRIESQGRYKIIDKVKVRLNTTKNRYECSLSNIGLDHIEIGRNYIKEYEKLLTGGIWCIITLNYYFEEGSHDSPFIIEKLKPIQMPNLDMKELFNMRKYFDKEEWLDILIRSTGLEPTNLSRDAKWHLMARMVPYVENNYNMCELGPRNTGKSYLYDEISPNSILVSGGQTTVPNLFYNMKTKTVGLVGAWDIVAFDEVAGIKFKDNQGVQIMKGFMANGSFSRGKEAINANASLVFIGNIDGSIDNIIKTSHLFKPFPEDMDAAFYDRMHCYIPGWEIPKLHTELITNSFGFISDYLAEWMREMRKYNFADNIFKYFKLGKDLNTRDTIAVKKTTSGLLKLLYPNEEFGKEEVSECLEYALTTRRRVKEQLKVIGGMEFYDVHFSYLDILDEEETYVGVPESGGDKLIPEGKLKPGSVFCVASSLDTSNKGLFKVELQKMKGRGKFTHTGFGKGKKIKEELKEAINYLKGNLSSITQQYSYSEYDFHLKGTNYSGGSAFENIELAIFISLVSGILEKSVLSQMVVIGSMSIGGSIVSSGNLADSLQIAADSGAKKVLIPASDMGKAGNVPSDIISKFNIILYNDPISAVFKALGVE